MSEFWKNCEKPPSEIWVQVLDGDSAIEAMAFIHHNEPHWRLRDGTKCHPSRYSRWREIPSKESLDHTMFFGQRSDGLFYRGAKLWKWTRSWRRAAVMTHDEWVYLKKVERIPCGTKFLTLSDILHE